MKGWQVGLGLGLLVAAGVGFTSTAAAKPATASELDVSPDCSRIEVKDKAKIVARVGAVVVGMFPSDDTPLLDVVLKVLGTLVPQCSWPPAEGLDPEFISKDGAAKWSQVLAIASSMTWGQAKAQLGNFDMATPVGANPQEIAAGLTIVAALAGHKGYG